MTDELKPCPFCGSTNLRSGGDDKVVGTWCLNCEAIGPNHYGSHEWNTRADTPDTANEEARHGNREALDAMTKRAEEAEAKLEGAMEALEFYASGCSSDIGGYCGYSGNMCCQTARAAIAELKGENDAQ